MPWYIMSTTICFECLPDLGEMASNQTIQHTKLLNLLENRWISPYLPLIWWIPPSSATSTTTCFMDPPDMSEIAPDPTILDLTEAPPRLGRASDRGRSSPRRHRASDRKEWSDQGRTEPRGLVVRRWEVLAAHTAPSHLKRRTCTAARHLPRCPCMAPAAFFLVCRSSFFS